MTRITEYQNTTVRITAAFKDAQGTPLDPDQWTIWSQLRVEVDAEPAIDFAVAREGQGWVLSLTPEQTSALAPGEYQFDVLGRHAGGDVKRLAGAVLDLKGTITELP